MSGFPPSSAAGTVAEPARPRAANDAPPEAARRANGDAAIGEAPPKGVAIIIAAWRAKATIARAVASALAQPETMEVIVVDDASGDGGATLQAARTADDGTGRLRLLALPANAGPAAARNAALAVAVSPWVTVLDADDYMLPGRLGQLLKLVAPDLDFVADDLFQVAEGAENGPRRTLWFADAGRTTSLTFESFIRGNIPKPSRTRGELGFLKPLMRRAFLERRRLRYDETMRLGEDYDLYVRALAEGAGFLLAPAAGYVSVIRDGSLSDARGRRELETFLASDDRLLAQVPMTRAELGAVRAHREVTLRKIGWIDFIDALKKRRAVSALRIMFRSPRQALHIANGVLRAAPRRIAKKVRANG